MVIWTAYFRFAFIEVIGNIKAFLSLFWLFLPGDSSMERTVSYVLCCFQADKPLIWKQIAGFSITEDKKPSDDQDILPTLMNPKKQLMASLYVIAELQSFNFFMLVVNEINLALNLKLASMKHNYMN